ncbi:protein-L-isoaspartate(D-aspartate) O-methyltransferase [Fodinibius salsisoli]|uniref:Protein-L-isoaspartate O-methyltransferase n=1 Tax=Fodinibius salsisoli TaxID=2820877 RepID=A0ABT3PJI4_9BACT|nr:protein-L-isoaspartate(D-aspartate) O-methyltransferase [Fodinibius salsisoli]MCW9706110.1 protein-L-isoaspartate(D-aspartate) O-methyltransferase [Fodinibius salsisoli]
MKYILTMITALIGGCMISLLFSVIPLSELTDNTVLAQQSETISDTVRWERPRFSERKNERHQLVERGIQNKGVTDPTVLEAMRQVPRHLFVPKQYQSYAYQNRPLPIGYNQTISQPYIVAYMTQMLNLEAGEKVLEIGTGSGYQAAVLSELTSNVFTIEIVEPLGQQAKSRFDSLGYSTIKTKIGDGYKGWSKHAPFDAIILTAAPEEIPQPLIEQLAPGGVLVAPVGRAGKVQMLTKVTKDQNGKVEIQKKLPVRFVPMMGGPDENGSEVDE